MSYGPTQTSWSYTDAPEDKTPLEIRPSLEKGEDSHVRDCLIWHATTPQQRLKTLEREGYRVFHYGAGGPGYWSNSDCGQSGCRTCGGGDHLINRDVGYVRRNELGRTIDRGFTSKPDKLKTAEELAASRGYTVRYEPVETPRLRDPYNQPVRDVKPAWNTPRSGWDEWNDGGRSHRSGAADPAVDRWKSPGDNCCNNQKQCCGPKPPSCCCNSHSCSPSGPHSCNNNNSNYNNNNYNNYDYNYNKPSFPRIDERDPGSVSYRGPPPQPFQEQSPPRPYRPFDPPGPAGPPQQTRPGDVYEGPKQVVGNESAFPAPAGMAGASQPTPRKPKGGITFDV